MRKGEITRTRSAQLLLCLGNHPARVEAAGQCPLWRNLSLGEGPNILSPDIAQYGPYVGLPLLVYYRI